MPKHRSFEPLDQLPSTFPNSIQEHLSGIGSSAFQVRIKPGAAGTLEVPAGAGNDQVGITIDGRWRHITAPVEHAGWGAARTVDVWVTAADNSFTAGSPGEVDNTDYSFALAIAETGVPPTGFAVQRQVAVAQWDGGRFVAISPLVGGVSAQNPFVRSFGKCIIPGTETRTNAAYGLMPTPDEVPGIVMPQDGLICVAYNAIWANSVVGAGRAAIFLGANQQKVYSGLAGGPVTWGAANNASAINAYVPLATVPIGLSSGTGSAGTGTPSVTTGQTVSDGTTGGFSVVFAAAGAYDVSVQFLASSGSVTVKDRRLWVWSMF